MVNRELGFFGTQSSFVQVEFLAFLAGKRHIWPYETAPSPLSKPFPVISKVRLWFADAPRKGIDFVERILDADVGCAGHTDMRRGDRTRLAMLVREARRRVLSLSPAVKEASEPRFLWHDGWASRFCCQAAWAPGLPRHQIAIDGGFPGLQRGALCRGVSQEFEIDMELELPRGAKVEYFNSVSWGQTGQYTRRLL